jgi:heme O synthase-like polyprenyltransferase
MASIWDSCIEYAQDANGNPINDPSHAIFTLNCVPYLIDRLLQIALIFGGAIAVFFIVWGGFKIIRSAGDPKQMEGARNTIVYAIIGLIIVFLAYFIIAFIADVTGVQCLKTFSFDSCNL